MGTLTSFGVAWAPPCSQDFSQPAQETSRGASSHRGNFVEAWQACVGLCTQNRVPRCASRRGCFARSGACVSVSGSYSVPRFLPGCAPRPLYTQLRCVPICSSLYTCLSHVSPSLSPERLSCLLSLLVPFFVYLWIGLCMPRSPVALVSLSPRCVSICPRGRVSLPSL